MDVMKLCAAGSPSKSTRRSLPARHPLSPQPAQPPKLLRLTPHPMRLPLSLSLSLSLSPFCRMMSDYKVQLAEDKSTDLFVIFHGPKDSALPPLAQRPTPHSPENKPRSSLKEKNSLLSIAV